MSKINFKLSSNIAYTIVCVILVIANIALILVPDRLKLTPYSLKGFKEKYVQAMANIESYKDGEQQVAQYKAEAEISRKKQELLKTKIGNTDWKIHIPSFLILMEQNAQYYKLDFTLFYDRMRTGTSQQKPADQVASTPADNKASTDNKAQASASTKTQPETTTKTTTKTTQPQDGETPAVTPTNGTPAKETATNGKTNKTGDSVISPVIDLVTDMVTDLMTDFATEDSKIIDQMLSRAVPPTVKGLVVTQIPIKIVGNYDDVREYLNFLDRVDFIEPYLIEIYSDGSQVKAYVIVNIIAKEGSGIL